MTLDIQSQKLNRVWGAIILTQVSVVFLFVSVLTTANSVVIADNVPTVMLPTESADMVLGKDNLSSISQQIVDKPVAAIQTQPVDYPRLESFITEKVKQEVAKEQSPNKNVSEVLKVELRQNAVNRDVEWRCLNSKLWTALRIESIRGDSCP